MSQTDDPKVFKKLRFCVQKDGLSKSLFWVSHLNDGSVIVEPSYANPREVYYGKFSPSDVSGGDVSYHKLGTKVDGIIPKFVYHVSGQTHFSKDPSIRSAYPVQHIPFYNITEQTQVFSMNINGNFENFTDFNEEKRKKRDLKELTKNIVFADKIVDVKAGIRHTFRFLIEPAEGFHERHPIMKKDAHFYKGDPTGIVFVYNLILGFGTYKCLVVYDTVDTPQDDNHVVLFGSIRPQFGGLRMSDDVQFIVLNC